VHVAVDLRILDRDGMERTGIGRQALEATRAVRTARPDWEFTVHSNRADLLSEADGLTVRRTRWPTGSALGRQGWLHLAAVRAGSPPADVWWSPAFTLPARWTGPSVITIHDLVFQLRPELYRGRLRARYVSGDTRRSARRAGRVLCPSTATRDRVVTELRVDPGKVIVAPWGISQAFREVRADRSGDYILCVGRWEARKGLDVLHAALEDARGRGRPVRLVLAGGPGWGADEAIRALRADPDVEVALDPTDERLADLYGGALALVYPSRMEGFGLPVAEAMACGCPVVASDLPEIREWAKDAPLYVEAGDARRLADALLSVAGSPERRERMTSRGREIAAGLTWEAFGETAAAAIEAAVADGSERG